jgi:hypothetical protein
MPLIRSRKRGKCLISILGDLYIHPIGIQVAEADLRRRKVTADLYGGHSC